VPYLNVTEVESALLVATAAPFSAFTQLITIPKYTFEGRQCHAIKIANGSGPGRPGVFFLGGVHAREWGSADILVNFIERVEQAYQAGTGLTFGSRTFPPSAIRTVVDTLDLIVFPQANPDGRHHSMTADAMWRKNRRVFPTSPACPGVDINRNFNFLWNFPLYFSPSSAPPASLDPCSEVYRGPSPFSERESQSVQWIFDNFPGITSFIDIHSHGQTILYSWGDDESQSADPSMTFMNGIYNGRRGVGGDKYKEYIPPADRSTALDLADALHNGIQAVRSTAYTVKPAFTLYPTSGASDDYAYSRHFVDHSKGKVISFTLEWGTEFQPPYPEMQNIIAEVTSGLLAFCLKICEMEDAMAWQLAGNSGTNPATNFLGTTDTQPLVIKTDGKEALHVAANGNIGIGSASPRAGLEIDKGSTNDLALLLSSSGLGWGSGIQLRNAAQGGKVYGIYSGLGQLHFADVDNSVDRLVIAKTGNVGIGTNTPRAGLEINKSATNDLTLLVTSSGPGWGSGIQFQNTAPPGKTYGIYSGSEGNLHFADADNATDRLTIDRSGNVGIGTAQPSNKLGVFSNSQDSYALRTENTGGGGAIAGVAQGSVYPSIVGLARGNGAGVHGHAVQTTKSSIGVIGTAGAADPYLVSALLTGGIGVMGHAGTGVGVGGISDGLGTTGNGVEGHLNSGAGAGVYGRTSTALGVAVYGQNAAGGQAGRFIGNVAVQGTLSASSKPFRIDHPLDPGGKYLNHSSIESPDMMNVYNGNITTDSSGEAVVRLPDYFEALNRDFKYQLTVIGKFAQAVVAREIEGNRFVVRTDRGDVKVSWQVTGVRKDPYAEAHRIVVEEEKPDAERGQYLHPELYRTASPELDLGRPIGWITSMLPGNRADWPGETDAPFG
jgi:carboxypeptidase T